MDGGARWQCRRGYLFGGVDSPNDGETNERETPTRSAVLGASSPKFLRWHFFVQTERRRCRVGGVGSVFAPPQSTSRAAKTNIGEEVARKGHFGSIAIVFPPGGLTRAGGQKAMFANQLRGVDATAESPRSLTRKQPRAGDKVAECAILAEWPWILPAGAELASGEKTDDGEPIGPRVTLAVSPRLFSRRSWPPIRKKNE